MALGKLVATTLTALVLSSSLHAADAQALTEATLNGPVYIPDAAIGLTAPAINGQQMPLQPSIKQNCSMDGAFIIEWELGALHTDVSVAQPDGSFANSFLGYIAARCSTGQQLDDVMASYSYDASCSTQGAGSIGVQRSRRNANMQDSGNMADALFESASLNASQTVDSPDGFKSISYRTGISVSEFMGVGGKDGALQTAVCPINHLVVGFSAAPTCYGITSLQVLCQKVRPAQDLVVFVAAQNGSG